MTFEPDLWQESGQNSVQLIGNPTKNFKDFVHHSNDRITVQGKVNAEFQLWSVLDFWDVKPWNCMLHADQNLVHLAQPSTLSTGWLARTLAGMTYPILLIADIYPSSAGSITSPGLMSCVVEHQCFNPGVRSVGHITDPWPTEHQNHHHPKAGRDFVHQQFWIRRRCSHLA